MTQQTKSNILFNDIIRLAPLCHITTTLSCSWDGHAILHKSNYRFWMGIPLFNALLCQ